MGRRACSKRVCVTVEWDGLRGPAVEAVNTHAACEMEKKWCVTHMRGKPLRLSNMDFGSVVDAATSPDG